MTTTGTSTRSTAARTTASHATEERLRAVLREDGLVTAAVGLAAVLGTTLAGERLWGGDVAPWLAHVVGAVLVVVGADLVLAARLTGRRLRLAATVTMELALAWVLASAAVLVLVDLPRPGVVAVGAAAAVTAGFAAAYARLLRR